MDKLTDQQMNDFLAALEASVKTNRSTLVEDVFRKKLGQVIQLQSPEDQLKILRDCIEKIREIEKVSNNRRKLVMAMSAKAGNEYLRNLGGIILGTWAVLPAPKLTDDNLKEFRTFLYTPPTGKYLEFLIAQKEAEAEAAHTEAEAIATLAALEAADVPVAVTPKSTDTKSSNESTPPSTQGYDYTPEPVFANTAALPERSLIGRIADFFRSVLNNIRRFFTGKSTKAANDTISIVPQEAMLKDDAPATQSRRSSSSFSSSASSADSGIPRNTETNKSKNLGAKVGGLLEKAKEFNAEKMPPDARLQTTEPNQTNSAIRRYDESGKQTIGNKVVTNSRTLLTPVHDKSAVDAATTTKKSWFRPQWFNKKNR